MATQSRLENIGISKRTELINKNDYIDRDIVEGKEYDENHLDAKAENGDHLGKGSGVSMGYAVADPDSFSISSNGVRKQQMNYNTLLTKETDGKLIGGEYDRNGRGPVEHSGRNALIGMNRYREGSEYGENSVDTSENILLGQYKVQ